MLRHGLTVTYDDFIAVDPSTSRSPTARSCASSGRAAAARARCSAPSPAWSPTPPGASRGTATTSHAIPPHRRGFGLMFQDHALFPHRDVQGNVAFGLRMQRLPRPEIDTRTRRRARAGRPRRLRASPRSRELSGGEQQRVALARALAAEPRLLMLDEPLGALDRALRERLVAELRALFVRLGLTTLFVTHDHDEAFALADRLVVMHDGRIEQVGHPGRRVAATGERVRRPVPRLERHPRASATRPSAVRPGAIRVGPTVTGVDRRRHRAHVPPRPLPPRRARRHAATRRDPSRSRSRWTRPRIPDVGDAWPSAPEPGATSCARLTAPTLSAPASAPVRWLGGDRPERLRARLAENVAVTRGATCADLVQVVDRQPRQRRVALGDDVGRALALVEERHLADRDARRRASPAAGRGPSPASGRRTLTSPDSTK